MAEKDQGIQDATKCLDKGTYDISTYKGVTAPLFSASAYEYVDVDEFVYPRYFNTPNLRITAELIASLEDAEEAQLFSSGLAATMTIFFTFLSAGDHIVLQRDIYGGTYDAVRQQFAKYNIEFDFVEGNRVAFEKATKSNTKLYFFESPSNPLLNLTDIASITSLAKEKNVLTVFDNTFSSPINQKPHQMGVDIVMQSATKYLGGHSDLCAGVASMSHALMEKVRETGIHFGGNPDPATAHLLHRSLKTLAIRVEKQNQNALELAKFLKSEKNVSAVYYPGLSDHPHHELAKDQMLGFGGMLSFEVNMDPDTFVSRLQHISAVMSLGGVESTITRPVATSHARMPESERDILGIKPNLLRMSVGIESADDLIEDLSQALNS